MEENNFQGLSIKESLYQMHCRKTAGQKRSKGDPKGSKKEMSEFEQKKKKIIRLAAIMEASRSQNDDLQSLREITVNLNIV